MNRQHEQLPDKPNQSAVRAARRRAAKTGERCSTRAAGMPAQLREERLEEDFLKKPLRLKNGGQIEARFGSLYYELLRSLLDKEPELFRALFALVNGQSDEILPEQRARLRHIGGYLERDGSIIPMVRDVLLSAYQVTPEGPVLANPFVLTSEQARELERTEKEGLDWLGRELRKKEDAGQPFPERRRDEDKGKPPER